MLTVCILVFVVLVLVMLVGAVYAVCCTIKCCRSTLLSDAAGLLYYLICLHDL